MNGTYAKAPPKKNATRLPFSILEADRMNGTAGVPHFIASGTSFQYPRSGSNEWNRLVV